MIKMPSSELARVCRDLSLFGDSVVITVTKEGVRFSTGGDVANGNIKLAQTANVDKEEDAVTIEMQEALMMTYSLRYFNIFSKASSLSPQVIISLADTVPAGEYAIYINLLS